MFEPPHNGSNTTDGNGVALNHPPFSYHMNLIY